MPGVQRVAELVSRIRRSGNYVGVRCRHAGEANLAGQWRERRVVQRPREDERGMTGTGGARSRGRSGVEARFGRMRW
jgi:hypothetical protein